MLRRLSRPTRMDILFPFTTLFRFLLLIAPLAAAVLWIGAPLAAAEEERTLSRVVFEFAVTGYCGLQDAAVEAGYHAEVAALTARHGFDAEAARRQRLRGWVAAEAEWRNRGLGGDRKSVV